MLKEPWDKNFSSECHRASVYSTVYERSLQLTCSDSQDQPKCDSLTVQRLIDCLPQEFLQVKVSLSWRDIEHRSLVRSINFSLLSRRVNHHQFIRFEWWRVLLNDSRQRISIKQAGYQWNSISYSQLSSWVHQDPLWIRKDHPVLQRNLIWSISKNHRSSQNFQLTNIRTHSWLRSFQQ